MISQDTYRNLRKNTLIIAVANIGSKAIAFILAPLYSYYLTTTQYGTMDLITTTINLIVPLYCLDVYEATFRFSSDYGYDPGKVLTSSLAVCIPSVFISIISIIACLFMGKKMFYFVGFLC